MPPAKTKEVEETLTYKVATEPVQEYHLMIRTVNDRPNEQGAMTVDHLDADVMSWLNRGYRLYAIHHISEVKGHAGESYGIQFAYHFVKTNE